MSRCNGLPELISSCVLEKYNMLPKKGKPAQKNDKTVEWTILAGIVKQDQENFECVALGTGTKCLGGGELSKFGDLVNDSHAEILARRSFNRYILEQIEDLLSPNCSNHNIFYITEPGPPQNVCKQFLSDESVFDHIKARIKLKNVSFHLYSSQCPCGDASTNMLLSHINNYTPLSPRSTAPHSAEKRKHQDEDSNVSDDSNSNSGSNSDSHTYSKKPLDLKMAKMNKNNGFSIPSKRPFVQQDGKRTPNAQTCNTELLRGRQDFSKLHTLRTKPGRSDADSTLSMSCSDKIALWNITGVQSALVSILAGPIYLSSIVVSDFFDCNEVNRSLNKRIRTIQGIPSPFTQSRLEVLQTNLKFPHSLDALEKKHPGALAIPCEASINWYSSKKLTIEANKQEVIVKGKKQGAAKQPKHEKLRESSRSRLCKLEIFKAFIDTLDHVNSFLFQNRNADSGTFRLRQIIEKKTLANVKKLSIEYQTTKKLAKNGDFRNWVQKPAVLQDFLL